MKLSSHPVRTGQARRGRSAKPFGILMAVSPTEPLTALSMSNGLPGHASGEQNVSKGSFVLIMPLAPPVPLWGDGTRFGQCETE